MRFSSVLACVAAAAVPAYANIIEQRDILPRDNVKVPGESPLELCPGEHDDDLIVIENVDLTPNPPQAGKELVINASGIVKEKIEEGAYILLTVKYGLIRLISTKADLCEQIGNVDLECPVEKGKVDITKSVDLPAEIPPGKYTVQADVYTVDGRPLTCLTASVAFKTGGIAEFFNGEL